MAKVMVEIEIPDGHEISHGPRCQPMMVSWNDGNRDIGFLVTTRPIKPLIICGKPAEWPEWLTCNWIAKDRGGQVCGYFTEPVNSTGLGQWYSDGIGVALLELLDIDIPGPWEQSKRENPRRKK